MSSIIDQIVSYFRIIPRKAAYSLYQYYMGKQSRPAIRMDNISKLNSAINHVNSLTLDATEIMPGLFLGNAYNATNYTKLNSQNIRHIVNISTELPNSFSTDINYLNIEIVDDGDNHIYEHLGKIIQFLDNIEISRNNAVLVHCYMGSSRSASAVLAYLIHKYHFTFDEGLAHIRKHRPIVNINRNFLDDVKKYCVNI